MQVTLAALLAQKSILAGGWFALFIIAERIFPAADARLAEAGWRRVGRNIALWAANAVLSPAIVIPVSAWAASHALFARPPWWGGGGALALDLVVLDGLIYWWHRANHRVALLWRFHAVHHLDRTLDATTALRFHFGEVLISACARAGVIVLLAVPLASVIAFETLVLAATIFHHSNLRLPPAFEAALARLVVTPSIHWVHHRRRQADTDSNYATVLSLWDPLFRSRSPTRRASDMEIGIEGSEERPLWGLVAAPFTASASLPGAGRSSRTGSD
jgi:sterol desaturase/sphingolipid hydroxylase (fatty acid hydroxylase superfamily)